MSVQLATPPPSDQTARAPRRRTRTLLVVAGITAAIAAGGVAASQMLLPGQSSPAQESQYVPSDAALRELDATIAAEYRTGLTTAPSHNGASDQRMSRQMRDSIANQYRSR
jgi:hypothetical protein